MNNQKETFYEKKREISKKKVVVTIATVILVIAIGIFFSLAKNMRDFLKQDSAIAMESFRNIFAPSSSPGAVSEIDLASSGFLNDDPEDETSSFEEDFPVKKESKTAAASSTKTNPRDSDKAIASSGQSMDPANVPPQKAIIPKTSPITESVLTESSSATIVASSTGISSITNRTSVASTSITPATCSFPSSAPVNFSRRVTLNEIAWMGSPAVPGETADHAANREWIELKNISGDTIPLNGWSVVDPAEKIKILFGGGDELMPGNLLLLSRSGNSVSGMSADKAYTGILANDGDRLVVFDASCGVSDFLDASAKWPGGSNATKQTLERTSDFSWQTSAAPGGTPRAENSAGAPASVASSSTEMYPVSVAISGDGSGKVTIKPGSVVCAVSCTNEYASGTVITLAAASGSGVDFAGWSGGCFGQSNCSLTVNGSVSIVAIFRSSHDTLLSEDETDATVATGTVATESSSLIDIIAPTSSVESTESSTIDSQDNVINETSSVVEVGHAVIAAVEITGAESSNDFVKIYNPTNAAIDMSAWKLRKKSSTGSDASIRELPASSVVAPGAYFTWANSTDGFAQSIAADTSSTATLAANNSVALFDATGAEVDAVAWGTGTDQYVEGAPYPTSPVAGQILQRKFTSGIVVDTDNNSNDFSL